MSLHHQCYAQGCVVCALYSCFAQEHFHAYARTQLAFAIEIQIWIAFPSFLSCFHEITMYFIYSELCIRPCFVLLPFLYAYQQRY